jgi:geranylgeranyl diphosphate synthase type I
MNAKQALEDLVPAIDKAVNDAFDHEFRKSKTISPFINSLIKNMKPLVFNGKRLRGALVYYSYMMHKGTDMKEILKASAFIELIHTYMLIMDDIIDEDDLRHKSPTLNKIYREIHKHKYKLKDSKHFGDSIAICGGLIMAHMGQNILVHANFPPERILKALDKFNTQIAYTGYGEALDVLAEVKDKVTEGETLLIKLLKTAKYTYETPLYLGAILAGANDEDLEKLSKYAIPAGVAFQIQDDILGIFGTEEKLGKPADSDLQEGKRNIVTVKTLELSNVKDRKRFSQLLGNTNTTHRDLEEAREIIKRSGAYDYSKNKARELVLQAKESLTKITKYNSDGKAFLDGIADYMIERDV